MEAAQSSEWQSARAFQIVMPDVSSHLNLASAGGGGVNRDKREAQYGSGWGGQSGTAAAEQEEGKSLTCFMKHAGMAG